MPHNPFLHPIRTAARALHRLKRLLRMRGFSSKFLTPFDQSRIFHYANRGLVIDGRLRRLSRKDSFQHLALLSPTGGGKTTTFVVPNLLTLDDCSMVVTDPSGELFETCSGYLAKKGFSIKVLNLQEPSRGAGYNPLNYANSFTEIDKLAKTIVESNAGQVREAIWTSQASGLISVFIRCLKNTPPQFQNLHNVLHLIQHWDVHPENKRSRIMNFVATYAGDDQGILNQFKGFLAGNPRMISSFVTQATDSLKLLNNPEIASMMARDQFDFDQLRREKTAVFLIVPETDTKLYQFILNAFWTQLFDAQRQLRYKREGYPLFCLMDEFGHSRIHDFATVATTIRKYRVSLSILLQSYAQLKEQYGLNDANTILSGGMRSKLFLSGLDLETSLMAEQMVGQKRTEMRPGKPEAGHRSESLLPADRIRRLFDDEALYLVSNEEPARFQTFPFYRRGKFRRAMQLDPIELKYHARDSNLSFIPLDDVNPLEIDVSQPNP